LVLLDDMPHIEAQKRNQMTSVPSPHLSPHEHIQRTWSPRRQHREEIESRIDTSNPETVLLGLTFGVLEHFWDA